MNEPTQIYFDDAATTRPDPRVRDAMLPWLDRPANAHIRHHLYGSQAAAAVARARTQIASVLGCAAEDIIFTSGATESNNLILSGLAAHLRRTGKTHIITCAVEHKSILNSLAALDGFTVTILPVKPCGMIEATTIAAALTPHTGLVTIQAVNNITGTIQPLAEIAAALAGKDIIFHTDAAQALGKTPFAVNAIPVTAASICAHKIYGPAGIGALYIAPSLRPGLAPLLQGGGQENGLRAGTLPVFLCAGFGIACTLLTPDDERIRGLRNRLLAALAPLRPEIFGHRDPAWNVPHIICLRFAGIDHDTLLMMLPGLAFSIGAACGAGGGTVKDHVVTAIAGPRAAQEAIRLSIGRFTTENDIDQAASLITAAITTIRQTQENT